MASPCSGNANVPLIIRALKESPRLAFSNADVGFASSAYLVGAVLGAIFFGWLADPGMAAPINYCPALRGFKVDCFSPSRIFAVEYLRFARHPVDHLFPRR